MEQRRHIRLPFRINLSIPAGHTEVTWDAADAQKQTELGSAVVSAALAIEQEIDGILQKTLFREIKKDLEFVSGHILQSDWCTFSAKRKLILSIVARDQLLRGKDRSTLEKGLSKVMKYRNAFAHGRFEISSTGYLLKYFDEGPKTVALTNEFWSELEGYFNPTFEILHAITNALGSSQST